MPKGRKAGESRKFGKKTLKLKGECITTKEAAIEEAKKLRADKKSARIVKAKCGYKIFSDAV